MEEKKDYQEKNYFKSLNDIDVSNKVEQKNGLSYLSWAWAWRELKRRFPDSTYTIYENADGWFYFTDGRTAWVKTGVTVCGIEHIEYLPVMDNRNRSIPLANITSYDVNKAIQRSLTKAVARHGLGLYIYAGEDLPEVVKGTPITPELLKEMADLNINIENTIKYFKVAKAEDLTAEQAIQAIRAKQNALAKEKNNAN